MVWLRFGHLSPPMERAARLARGEQSKCRAPAPPYSGCGGVWSIAPQAFSRTMTGWCLASRGEAEGRKDKVKEGRDCVKY